LSPKIWAKNGGDFVARRHDGMVENDRHCCFLV